ncbi:MAG: hypothetical protein AAFW95_02380 [Cyanobacteria bacterium J06638_6]
MTRELYRGIVPIDNVCQGEMNPGAPGLSPIVPQIVSAQAGRQ